MEKPDFPLPAGKYVSTFYYPASKHIVHLLPGHRYVVTGGRETQAVLTIHQDGDTWELGEGASLHDVTHLPCRSGNQSLVKSRVASGIVLMTI